MCTRETFGIAGEVEKGIKQRRKRERCIVASIREKVEKTSETGGRVGEGINV